jgi:hypothetical protein
MMETSTPRGLHLHRQVHHADRSGMTSTTKYNPTSACSEGTLGYSEVHIVISLNNPTTLFSNNQSVIALSKNHQYHMYTKHIDICFHFIQWIIEEGKVHLIYCPTEDMVADLLTVNHFASEMGLCDA